jgi:hypothetical protein
MKGMATAELSDDESVCHNVPEQGQVLQTRSLEDGRNAGKAGQVRFFSAASSSG